MDTKRYEQTSENDEYRYFQPSWLEAMARGLTAGNEKHPNSTWKTIPSKEHAWRAVRHLIKYINDDTSDEHLLNASMRCMFAYCCDENNNKEAQRNE